MPSRLVFFRLALVAVFAIAVFSSMPTLVSAQRASPRSGEGVNSFLKRNGISPTPSNVSEFREINTGHLLSDGGLMRDTSYLLPSSANIRYELFGGAYATIKRISNSLDGVAYFLVSGHGGKDPGATGTRGGKPLHEDEYAYDVTLRIAHGLMAHGAEVHVMVQDEGIRDTEYLEPDHDERNIDGTPVSDTNRVQERVDKINARARASKSRIKRVIEIHVDARDDVSTQVDVHFYYFSQAGKRVSTILRDTMRDQYKRVQPGRGYYGKVSRRAGLYTLEHTDPVATYVELGNIHEERDQRRIVKPRNRQLIADWMVLGLLKEIAEIHE